MVSISYSLFEENFKPPDHVKVLTILKEIDTTVGTP